MINLSNDRAANLKDSFFFGEREERQGRELESKLFKEDQAIRMRDQRSNVHITLHVDIVVDIRVSQSPCPLIRLYRQAVNNRIITLVCSWQKSLTTYGGAVNGFKVGRDD